MSDLSAEQERENRRRAEAAKVAIKAWACGGYIEADSISEEQFAEDEEMILGDFLADLLHYFHSRDLEFSEFFERGFRHFSAEITPEQEEEDSTASSEEPSDPAVALSHDAEIDRLGKDIVDRFCRSRRKLDGE